MAMKEKLAALDASRRDGVQYRKASWFDLIISSANAGTGMCFYLLMTYASYIGTQGYGITTAMVGMILTGMRIFDGVTDALFAAFFEKMPARFGKIRIFMIGGWALTGISVITMYSWAAGKFEGAAGVAVFVISYVFYIFGYTINGMGGTTIGIIITNDPNQRPMMGLIGTAFTYLTPMVFNNVIAFLILPKYGNQYNMPMLKEACWLYVAVAGILVLLASIGVRKVDTPETFESLMANGGSKAEKVKWKDMWNLLSKNGEAQMYMISCISDKFAQQTASQAVISTMMSGVLIGSYTAAAMVGNVTMVVGLLFAFLGGLYVARFGAKQSTVVWSWVSIAVSVVMVAFCTILGPQGMSKIGVFGLPLIFYCVLQVATTATKMILTTTGNTMRADVVDYELERSGKYLPAVLSGVYNLIDKLCTSICSMVAGFCVAAIGYVNTVPQMGDPATWPLFWMTMAVMFGLPVLGWLCNVVAMRFYTLDKKRIVEVQKSIAKRKEAK